MSRLPILAVVVIYQFAGKLVLRISTAISYSCVTMVGEGQQRQFRRVWEGRGARLYLARYRFFFQSRISAERAVPAWRCLRSAARGGGGDFPRNWYTRLATVNLNGRRDNFHEIKLLRAIDLYIGSFGHLALFYAFLYCARFFRTSWNFQSTLFDLIFWKIDTAFQFIIYWLKILIEILLFEKIF